MKKIVITLFLLFSICLPTSSQVVHITLDNAVNLALENNLDLKSKRKKAEELQQEIKIANALKNPRFESNFLIGRVTRGNSSQFGLSVPVEVAKRGIRKKIAQTNLDIVEKEIKASEHDIKIEIMKNYFNILYLKSVVLIFQEREKLFKNLKTIAEQKSKKYVNYDVDILQADMKYKRQLVYLNKAKADLLIAQFKLNDTINIKNSENMYDTIEESLFINDLNLLNLTLLPYQTIEDTAMKYSYSLAIAESNITKSEQEVTQAKRQRIPNLTIGGGTAYQTAHQTGGDSLPGAYIAIGADIPILYSYSPDIKKAKIVLERSNIDKDSFENHLRYALKQDYNEFKYAKANMEHYKNILSESQKLMNTYSKRYEKGQTSLQNFIQVETMHQETLKDYIGAAQAYYDSYLNLMHNVGHDILMTNQNL
ncbi:TPA: TolC family protein [Candidatus Gastranaerophilales bacterium HUM_6]|nr:glr3618 protein [Fusobacterium sp. CAG:815]DAA90231.1 MAG TPA: TolC family protein [Candidatus Gastranaerophilales bacterium HUM_6]DAA95112.1 MAG TPA: TolC family protein [Candidatus Gastranaerophilales bacterium HUM_7]DAB02663.1 MAG TPA: TolC family protein [Candidatus Gastranaerophilales bacterium HUM_12]DAB06274.1 MAG TPA: TolC family protein [Candidatus Gastranaerophilales bacterium HUM_14]